MFFNRVLDAIDDFFGSGAPARYAQWLEEHPSCRAGRLCRDPMRDDPKSLRLLRDPWLYVYLLEPVGWFSRLCALFSARSSGDSSPASVLPDAALRFCTAVDSGENAVCSVGPGWYRLEKSFASLLPLILAGVTNNFSAPLSGLRFRAEGGTFVCGRRHGRGWSGFVPCGRECRAERGTVVIHGEPYAIAARAQFRLDEEGRDVLFLDVFFLEAPSVRRLKIIRTGEDSILVRFLEYPSVEEAARMLLTLVGGDTGASGGVWDLFGQDVIWHRLYGRMKEICFPRAAGRLQARREELPESVRSRNSCACSKMCVSFFLSFLKIRAYCLFFLSPFRYNEKIKMQCPQEAEKKKFQRKEMQAHETAAMETGVIPHARVCAYVRHAVRDGRVCGRRTSGLYRTVVGQPEASGGFPCRLRNGSTQRLIQIPRRGTAVPPAAGMWSAAMWKLPAVSLSPEMCT